MENIAVLNLINGLESTYPLYWAIFKIARKNMILIFSRDAEVSILVVIALIFNSKIPFSTYSLQSGSFFGKAIRLK